VPPVIVVVSWLMSVAAVAATVMLWTWPVADGLYFVLVKPHVDMMLSMSVSEC